MSFGDGVLNDIFEKTNETCSICGGKHGPRLRWSNHGLWVPTGWVVDHRRPRACCGTDDFSNLYPAHIACNARKSDTCPVHHRALFRVVAAVARPSGQCAAVLKEDGRTRCTNSVAQGSRKYCGLHGWFGGSFCGAGTARRNTVAPRNEPRQCAARLGYDGRIRCTNTVAPGSRKYCGVHYGWIGGSFD